MPKQTTPKKPLMLFLPGKLCDQRIWQYQMTALQDLVEPVCVDLQHHDSLDDMLLAIKNTTNIPFILAGFSLGGYVAQEFILKYPKQVIGLILVSCSAKGYPAEEKNYYRKLIKQVQEGTAEVMTGNAMKAYIDKTHHNNKEIVTLIESMANDAGNEVFIRQQTATLNRECRFDDLKEVNCPAIVIGGLNDQLVTTNNIKLTALSIKNSICHLLNQCGHMVPLEQTTKLNALMRTFILSNYS